VSRNLRQNWALGSRPTRTINRRLAGWAAKRIIAHEALCHWLSWVPGRRARFYGQDIWPPPSVRPTTLPLPRLPPRFLLLYSGPVEMIVQLLKCIMCIVWTFSTSPQKPPTTYTRVNNFRPHRDSLFRGATYTWERLIREYIRYISLLTNNRGRVGLGVKENSWLYVELIP